MSDLETKRPNSVAVFLTKRSERKRGFSLTELLIVLAVMGIVLTLSVPYLLNYRKLYRSDDQAYKIMDMMRESGQLALTRRRTMRFEIDLSANTMMIIDEDGSNPDRMIKSVPLDLPKDVRVDVNPTGVNVPNPPNYPAATYAIDGVGHLEGSTTVIGNNVWVARFQRDGSVVGVSGVPISASLFVWSPSAAGALTARNPVETRVITMFGGSGAMRYWRFDGTDFVAF